MECKMKKTALALAVLVALSGVSFAESESKKAPAPAPCPGSSLENKLDCSTTGTIRKSNPAPDAQNTGTKTPRLGFEMNPWFMPSTF
jgi:uncharacterized membrane protein